MGFCKSRDAHFYFHAVFQQGGTSTPENSLVRSGNRAPGVQLSYQVAGSGTLTKFSSCRLEWVLGFGNKGPSPK